MTQFTQGPDKDLIARVRNVVANSVMGDLAREDPQGTDELKAAVRHQIVAVFQRLRVLLLMLDYLMETYNSTTK